MNRKRKKNGNPEASDTIVTAIDTASKRRVRYHRLAVAPPP